MPHYQLTEIKFLQILMLNLSLDTINTIIFQYFDYQSLTNLMLGHQEGIKVKNKHNIQYYKRLFEHYQMKLEMIMSLYSVPAPDFIIIHIKQLKVEEFKQLCKNNQFPIQNKMIKKVDLKDIFNNKIMPLTLNEKYFGFLVESHLRVELLNNLINLQEFIEELSVESSINVSLLEFILSDYSIKEIHSKLKENIVEFLNLVISNTDIFRVFMSKNKLNIMITFLNNKFNYIRVVFNISTGKLVFSCIDLLTHETLDLLISDTSNYFMRKTGNLTAALNEDLNVDLFIKDIELDSIKPESRKTTKVKSKKNRFTDEISISRNPNFGVFDIETFVDSFPSGEAFARVYALGFCINRGIPYTFYLTDYFENSLEGSNKLVLACLDAMLIKEHHKFIFYVHNFGKYDAIFLYKIILDANLYLEVEEQYVLEPLYRDDRMLKLTVKKRMNNNKFIKITFVDSLNLLNHSLDKLSKDFNVTTTKGLFPYSFVNKDNLNYIGPLPERSFFNSNMTETLYSETYVEEWSLKDETINYLNRDLYALLQVMVQFQEHLWFDHNIDLTESLTISSLALTKFLKYYLKDSKIPLINSNTIFQFIYSGYYGGITEVYKPFGTNLSYLDVNSLYPFAALSPMPGLECQWIECFNSEGLDITKLFGFFYAVVNTVDSYLGFLPVKTKSGLVFPLGRFSGVWTSVEIKFAIEQGYKIKVIKGVQFNKQVSPFIEYVEELSKQKDQLKGSQRQIVKSLLNNLLGRFALNLYKPITKTVSSKDLDYILATKEVKTFKVINSENFVVTFNPIVNKEICENHNLDYFKVILNEKNIAASFEVFNDISIAMSAFVTAYARIHMHNIKLEIMAAGGGIYYTDTDSIVTDLNINQLKDSLRHKIGDKLGQLKLEHIVDKAYFISNKTYLLLTNEGKCIKKAKGVNSDSLTLADFEAMYFNNTSVLAQKLSSEIFTGKGFVIIKKVDITLNWDSFKKREKIFNYKSNLWVDTHPIYIDTVTLSITNYKPKHIVKYEKTSKHIVKYENNI